MPPQAPAITVLMCSPKCTLRLLRDPPYLPGLSPPLPADACLSFSTAIMSFDETGDEQALGNGIKVGEGGADTPSGACVEAVLGASISTTEPSQAT